MTSEVEQKTEQRYTMGPHSELSVSNVAGTVIVRAVEGTEIVVRHWKRGSRSRENADVEIAREGNKVSVQTRSRTPGLINFGRSTSVNYEISVPRDCRVAIRAVSADVQLEGSRADVGLQTVSGNARLGDIAGDISITTVSGDIQADNLSGTLLARTTSGDARIYTSRLRRFSINSVSGDFTLETPLVREENSQARTVSGDLELLVPADTGATVQLKSVSGGVSCELPAEIIKAGRRHWQGRINGGGSHVEMSSVSGDLRIRREGSARREARSRHAGHHHHEFGTDWHPEKPVMPDLDIGSIVDTVHETLGTVSAAMSGLSGFSTMGQGEGPGRHQNADVDVSGADTTSTPDNTAEILEALQRGDLSVDEAMAKLEKA